MRSCVENGGCSLNTAVWCLKHYRISQFFWKFEISKYRKFFCEDRLIINVFSLRWLIIKSPACLFKIYFCIIKVNIVINSCCASSCCLLHSVIFAFFLIDRLKGSLQCFSVDVNLFQGRKIALTSYRINLYREPKGGLWTFRKKMLTIQSSWLFEFKTIFIFSAFD